MGKTLAIGRNYQRRYSDHDRGLAYITLIANGGNIKLTARELGFPSATLRLWVRTWEKDGVPEELLVAAEKPQREFIADAEDLRNKAMRRLHQIVGDSTNVRELSALVGTLDDKINRVRATSHPIQVSPPAKADVMEGLGELLVGAIEQAAQRRRVIEAEPEDVVEVAALGPGPDGEDGT